MRLTVDREADALYLALGDAATFESELVAPGIVVDYDQSGQVVGIQVLHLSARPELDLSRLLFETVPASEPQ